MCVSPFFLYVTFTQRVVVVSGVSLKHAGMKGANHKSSSEVIQCNGAKKLIIFYHGRDDHIYKTE